MSSGFEKVLLQDGRLNSTPDIKFGVLKGAQSLSSSKYPASAVSSNSAVWNIQVPSQSTMVDTHVLLRSKLKVTVKGIPVNLQRLVDYGVDTAFAAFPCHQFMTNVSATINSNQVSVNMNDVLETIIRSLPKHELAAFEGMCPVLSDNVYEYESYQTGQNNNVLSAYPQTSTEGYLHPNGAHPVTISGNEEGDGAAEKTVILTIDTVEPLLFSPFTFGRMNSCEGGLYGITSMNFNFSFGNIARVLRSTKTFTSIEVGFDGNPELEFFYLTPHPSQAKNMNARNIHKFYKFDRIITAGQIINAGETQTITTQTTQLNSVPDKIFLFAKFKATGVAGVKIPDRHIPIQKVNINFNNISGLCSNFSKAQLYQCSREAGIQMSYLDWSGVAAKGGVSGAQGNIVKQLTSGSILGLNFAEHISLVEDYLAPNSLGNYNLQIDVTLKNETANPINADTYELYLVTMTSGVLALDKGSAAVYTALLSAEDVLKASDMEPMSKPTVERFIGGSVFDQIRSALPKVLPVARAVLEQIPHPYAQASSAALKSMGYAKLSDRMK